MFSIFADGICINDALSSRYTLLSPRLTLELGKAGALEFSVPPSHFYRDRFRPLVTKITVAYDGVEIFRGRVLSREKNFNNIDKIYCEGDLAYLVDSQIKGERFEGTTHALFERIIQRHNSRVEPEKQFAVGVIDIENRNIVISGQAEEPEDNTSEDYYKQIAINSSTDEWRTALDYIETCLIDSCGGYLRTRRANGVTYLDLITEDSAEAAQEIEFGMNLLDLVENHSADEIFTVLIPLGDDNLDISSVNNGSDELVDMTGVATYGRIVKTHVFSNVNTPETLLENGMRYLQNGNNIPNTFTAKAVDFHLIDSDVAAIYVGDRVHVNSAPHGISEYMTCNKIDYDLERPENNSYTFGILRQTLTEQYRRDKQKRQDTSSGAGGSGAAAAEAAVQKGQEELDRFYDAWINVDPEAANVNLGAVYKELKKTVTVLEQQVGIELDAVSGNVNIKSLKTNYDDLGNLVSRQGATLNVHSSGIEALVGYYNELDERESGNYSRLSLRANEQDGAIAELETRMGDAEAGLSTHASDINGLQTADASLSARVNGAEASISLHARNIDGNATSIAEIRSDLTQLISDVEIIGNLSIVDGRLNVGRGMSVGGDVVATGRKFVGGQAILSTQIEVAGTVFTPQQITSTTGPVTVLGY